MNRFAFEVLIAVAVVCALPGVSSAQYWSAEGPATRHDSGYVDPWEASAGVGPYWSGPRYTPSNYLSYSSYGVPSGYFMPRVPATEEWVASIQVQVPANAEIWFDNSKTTQTGEMRTYVSPPLENGKTLAYVVHARWTDASGKVVDQTKRVEVQAGQFSSTDFMPQLTKK